MYDRNMGIYADMPEIYDLWGFVLVRLDSSRLPFKPRDVRYIRNRGIMGEGAEKSVIPDYER